MTVARPRVKKPVDSDEVQRVVRLWMMLESEIAHIVLLPHQRPSVSAVFEVAERIAARTEDSNADRP